jgi:hypothetical protein
MVYADALFLKHRSLLNFADICHQKINRNKKLAVVETWFFLP